jgi:hypothetical protein
MVDAALATPPAPEERLREAVARRDATAAIAALDALPEPIPPATDDRRYARERLSAFARRWHERPDVRDSEEALADDPYLAQDIEAGEALRLATPPATEERCVVEGCGMPMASNVHVMPSRCTFYPADASGCVEPEHHHAFTYLPPAPEERCAHRNISFGEVGCVDCGRLLERDTAMTDSPRVMVKPTPPATEERAHLPECGGRQVCCSCHLFHPTPPATGPVTVGTMTDEEGRAFIEAAKGEPAA